ncbi:hypothetical protein BH24ACI5_BH24ACI5_21960 [soil metagenome]
MVSARRFAAALAAGAAALMVAAALQAQGPKFFRDDPLQREPETQDASKTADWDIPLTPDLLENMFTRPGEPVRNLRAQNVNTADEVPDSSWFTNRIYTRPVSLDELSKGPNTTAGPAPGRWTVIRPKGAGVSPGVTIRDERGDMWFISFDGRENPIAPTAAVMVATKLFWALGYNQIETHLTSIRPELIDVAPNATIREHGKRRPFTRADLEDVLARAARSTDGSYRAVAGRAVPGRPIGGFRYHGTRPDDPNDIVPHEHRRELRALKVFGAWTNLVDMKAGNTLDTVITENGRGLVRHYLQDVGSTFGTGALYPRDADEGYEKLVDRDAILKRLVSFGLLMQRWQTMKFAEHPEIGRFEGDAFEPETWTPRVPVAALRHVRSDDTVWAALRVVAFTDEQIRAAVKAGGFTDPAAEELLASVLMKRRDKIGSVYFARINPLTRFTLSESGELRFENPAVRTDVSTAPAKGYEAVWSDFDNATHKAHQIGTSSAREERMQAPAELPRDAQFIKISIRAIDPPHAPWAVPVDVYFRRDAGTWTLVGVERLSH